MKILDVEANFEFATYYGFAFRVNKYVRPHFNNQGADVIPLYTTKAVRSEFQKECDATDIGFVSGFGHGSEHVFTGHEYDTLWEQNGYNPREASGRIIHLLSCLTAQRLGPDLISKGAKAYFGYYEPFFFYTQDPPPSDPLQDVVADPFFECDSLIDRRISEGCRAQSVYEEVLRHFDARIEEWTEHEPEVARRLLWDRNALCFIGDPNARLTL